VDDLPLIRSGGLALACVVQRLAVSIALALALTPDRAAVAAEAPGEPAWIECRREAGATLGWERDGRRIDERITEEREVTAASTTWFALYPDGTVAREISVGTRRPSGASKWPVLARHGLEVLVLVHLPGNPGATLYSIDFARPRARAAEIGSAFNIASASALECRHYWP
jgi:hypothetical protein